MLKITPETVPAGGMTLRLAGRVTGPWVTELKRACEPGLAPGVRLRLDMAQVSFLDQEAAEFCRRLQTAEVDLTGCSPFVLEQIAQARTRAAGDRRD